MQIKTPYVGIAALMALQAFGCDQSSTPDGSISIQLSASVDGVVLEDGATTTGQTITIDGITEDTLGVAEFSYSWNEGAFQPITVTSDRFQLDLDLEDDANVLIVEAVNTTDASDRISVMRTYHRAPATQDARCQGPGTAAECQQACESIGGAYDADQGHIGGCNGIPASADASSLNFLRERPDGRVATTHDATCQGPGTAAGCQEVCEDLGGTYEPTWGHIGGCSGMPSSANGSGLNFHRERPADRADTASYDATCQGPGTAAGCQEVCEDLGGTYEPDWGHIGGCSDIPGSADAGGLSFLRERPDDQLASSSYDATCQGPGTAAGCQEVCEGLGGTYEPGWGHIGGCSDIPGSASADGLDFTGELPTEEELAAAAYDATCQGPGTAAGCQEVCEGLGGTYEPGWGHIGGCSDIPGSADASGLNFLRERPDEELAASNYDATCQGPGTAAGCQDVCESLGGHYEPDWGHIGGCSDIPGSADASGLNFVREREMRRRSE